MIPTLEAGAECACKNCSCTSYGQCKYNNCDCCIVDGEHDDYA